MFFCLQSSINWLRLEYFGFQCWWIQAAWEIMIMILLDCFLNCTLSKVLYVSAHQIHSNSFEYGFTMIVYLNFFLNSVCYPSLVVKVSVYSFIFMGSSNINFSMHPTQKASHNYAVHVLHCIIIELLAIQTHVVSAGHVPLNACMF